MRWLIKLGVVAGCGLGWAGCSDDPPASVIDAACETAYCPSPYQCQARPPCGGEPVAAFTCYGP